MRIQNRPSKQVDRSFFLAMQADAKDYPGGIRALAHSMELNPTTLANCLNPDHDAQPPSLAVLIEIIKTAQARRAVFSICQMVGQVPMDFELEPREPAEAIGLFLSLVSSASELLGTGSEAAKDGRFDASERRALDPLLMALMKATGELLQSIRGGAL